MSKPKATTKRLAAKRIPVIAESATPKLAASADTLASTLDELIKADDAGLWPHVWALLMQLGVGTGLRFDHLPDDEAAVVRDTYRLLHDARHHGPWSQLPGAIAGATSIEPGRMSGPLTLQAQLLRQHVPQAEGTPPMSPAPKAPPAPATKGEPLTGVLKEMWDDLEAGKVLLASETNRARVIRLKRKGYVPDHHPNSGYCLFAAMPPEST